MRKKDKITLGLHYSRKNVVPGYHKSIFFLMLISCTRELKGTVRSSFTKIRSPFMLQ